MISGIVCPETKAPRKIKQRNGGDKQKRNETSMKQTFFLVILKKKIICNQKLYCCKIFLL